MSTIHLHLPATTPEQYIAGLTDFGSGTTEIDVIIVRDGKNLKGRMLGFVPGTIGKGVLERRLQTPSKPSKPRTAQLERQTHRKLGRR